MQSVASSRLDELEKLQPSSGSSTSARICAALARATQTAIALELLPELQAEAAKRQLAGKPIDLRTPVAEGVHKGKAVEQAAAIVGVSHA